MDAPSLSYLFGMIEYVTAVGLRDWRGVKPVVGPSGVTISTRLLTTSEDEHVLDLVAEHLGRLRRADLSTDTRTGGAGFGVRRRWSKRQLRRDRLNTRKKALTAESSARWANAIIAGNDGQYRLASDAQRRHLAGLRSAITTLEKRLAEPTADTLTPEQRTERRKAELPKGYPSQAERLARSSAACRCCGPNSPGSQLTRITSVCMLLRVVSGWPRPATASRLQA